MQFFALQDLFQAIGLCCSIESAEQKSQTKHDLRQALKAHQSGRRPKGSIKRVVHVDEFNGLGINFKLNTKKFYPSRLFILLD